MQIDPMEDDPLVLGPLESLESKPGQSRTTKPGFCENCNVNYSEFRYYAPGIITGIFITFLMGLGSAQYNLGWVVAVFCGVVTMALCACMGPMLSALIELCDREIPSEQEYEEL
jgi:hypothetical protein